MPKQVVVLGATGSIGCSTLDVIAQHPDLYQVLALTGGKRLDVLFAQCMQFRPRYAALSDAADAAELQQQLQALDARIEISSSVDAACDNSDVIMLCTSSASPVLDPAALSKPALITSISTNAVNAHEVTPASLAAMDVYCDHKHSTPDSAGEMVLASQAGSWQRERIVGDLADLVSQRCALPDYQRPVFFRSIGMGLQDIAIACALLQQAQAAQ